MTQVPSSLSSSVTSKLPEPLCSLHRPAALLAALCLSPIYGATTQPAPATQPKTAPTLLPAATPQDGLAYPISAVELRYAKPSPRLPDLNEIASQNITLGKVADGYVALKPGVPAVAMSLRDLAAQKSTAKFYASAIKSLNEQLVGSFNSKGLVGVYITPSGDDIELTTGKDKRPAGSAAFHLLVNVAVVKEIRTVASGDRIPESAKINNPAHARIREMSKPAAAGAAAGTEVIDKDALDDYVLRLNRHPGRRVDVAIVGSDTPGAVGLDYLVSENKPWNVYAQLSNTGTKATNEWRERFGAVHNQLTGHDDTLSLDYVTAGFDQAHALQGSYEFPFFDFDRLRVRVFGSWSKFSASDIGLTGESFTGESWSAGGETIWNFYQKKNLFLDLVGGARYEGITQNNTTVEWVDQHADILLPYVTLRGERTTDLYSTNAALTLTGGFSGDSIQHLEPGTDYNPDRQWVTLQGELSHSFFLEPLFDPDMIKAGRGSLSHELFGSVRGQYALDNRLIPNFQDVVGGMYSVRGYPESVAAGDSSVVATAEYRYHLPRALAIQAEPQRIFGQPFRVAPQSPFARPDWDLILKGFFDVGQTARTSKIGSETNQTLAGTGLGVELQIKQNFNLRVDWGVALTDVPNEVDAGDNRFHISATFTY